MIDIVVPTIGRPSLARLLESIARARGPRPDHVILVDDRRSPAAPLLMGELDADFQARIALLPGGGRGPAAARNAGFRFSRARWIAFVDDDVLVDDDWLEALNDDVADLPRGVAGSTGNVRVPLPGTRKPTDWERNVAGLETARWITADCAYRRADLLAAGGFDERFERAFREDADLALRIVGRGKRIVRGRRTVVHPVRPAPWTISVRLQTGNADDVLMDALHGRDWHERASAPRGAFRAHVAIVASGAASAAFALVWAALTGRFAWQRIAPGPLNRSEILQLVATSVAIPFAAVYHRVRGYARRRALLADTSRAPRPVAAAVLFDRDGTLIVDVPLNADPALVVPMPHARAALDRLRAAGIATAVVSNQSAVASGTLLERDVAAINARTETLLGPLGPVFVCTHAANDGCACRKPAPGLIEAAASALDVTPRDCVVIGDIGADIQAAAAAGARSILVATPVTRAEEIAAAPRVAADLAEAVEAVLEGAV